MARVVGVEIPDNKPIWVALTYIYGIGRTSALKICEGTGIDPQKRTKELSDEELVVHPFV